MPTGVTTYSNKVPGTKRNYDWDVTFDLTDGYLGISQDDAGKVKDRVLLSPNQVRELLSFVRQRQSK